MFAGPNGSGKTTIKLGLEKPTSWFGLYLNPDDLEDSIRNIGRVSGLVDSLSFTSEAIRGFFAHSGLLREYGLVSVAESMHIESGDIVFPGKNINSYLVSVLADFLRQQALQARMSFSFETVMSHPGKADVLKVAQESGYRTYLYYVATDDPDINVARVKNRVLDGGHGVPEEKVRERYYRSLDLLPQAIRFANRGYFFDTSAEEPLFLAESTDGKTLKLFTDKVPNWFSPILSGFDCDIV